MRAQRLALIGGIALAIALTPALTVTVLAAEPTVVVQPGDTLTGIARRHGVSVGRLAELNHLADPNRIFVGQRLRVAGRGSRRPVGARPSAQPKTIHVVSSGSSLWAIAAPLRRERQRRSSAANGLANPSRIFAGQRLVIPGASAPASRHAPRPAAGRGCSGTAAEQRRVVHVVSRGSTLWAIAAHYGVSVSSIVAANRLANPSRIFVGQRLVIPGGTRPPPAPRPAGEDVVEDGRHRRRSRLRSPHHRARGRSPRRPAERSRWRWPGRSRDGSRAS